MLVVKGMETSLEQHQGEEYNEQKWTESKRLREGSPEEMESMNSTGYGSQVRGFIANPAKAH